MIKNWYEQKPKAPKQGVLKGGSFEKRKELARTLKSLHSRGAAKLYAK